jgi:predicted alpha/beta-hydrolase family hydrolase
MIASMIAASDAPLMTSISVLICFGTPITSPSSPTSLLALLWPAEPASAARVAPTKSASDVKSPTLSFRTTMHCVLSM